MTVPSPTPLELVFTHATLLTELQPQPGEPVTANCAVANDVPKLALVGSRLTEAFEQSTVTSPKSLVMFAAAFKAAGIQVVDGELPDYLPAVLDLAALDDGGWRLLRENRIGLDLLAKALAAEKSVYRHVIEAIQAMLPPAQPGDIAAAIRLARTGPPTELVGLEPYGGRR